MMSMPQFSSTYRLQLNHRFPMEEAEKVIPYLHELGIEAVYCSPYFAAVPGSLHGYDGISFRKANPEIASKKEFESFSKALKSRGMSQVFDLVINHMAASASNPWWIDVLEQGPASMYESFFDINWNPIQKHLTHKILLADLGEEFDACLEKGEIQLQYEKGRFFLQIYENQYPICPTTYSYLLSFHLIDLKEEEGHDEFSELIQAFRKLPKPYKEKNPKKRRIHCARLKRRLNALCIKYSHIYQHIERNVEQFTKEELFTKLLDEQNYKLAFWQEAAQDINYRRFFEIKDLIALQVEHEHVFNHVHRTIFQWIKKGYIDGLRIDHPDGLTEPELFFAKVREKTNGTYLIVEKILQNFENLPSTWQIEGTVGYEYLNSLSSLFVDRKGEEDFTKIYHSYTDLSTDLETLLYEKKKQFLLLYMLSEINNFTERFYQAIMKFEETLTITPDELKSVLVELISLFPVYRTYIDSETEKLSREEKEVIDTAFSAVHERREDLREFLPLMQSIFTLKHKPKRYKPFLLKFQQLSPPIFAKGFEDTFLYVYNRLVSLNEVGGEPQQFGSSPEEFHEKNAYRLSHWPSGMICTSTHDTKRSEDVRLRIHSLSEMPKKWEQKLREWTEINTPIKRKVETQLLPDPNAEYFIYQTLLGAFPHKIENVSLFCKRIQDYLIKAMREGKVYTNWYNVNVEYEKALTAFIQDLFSSYPKGPFWKSFLPFQKEISYLGMLNTLSSAALKLGSPGVLDIYQGIETWDYSLVDPDNRRPVPFAEHYEQLQGLKDYVPSLTDLESGELKLFLHWKGLHLRKQHKDIFIGGKYTPLTFNGPLKEHCVGFMRDEKILCIASRFYSALTKDHVYTPSLWEDTTVSLPQSFKCKDIFLEKEVHLKKEMYLQDILPEFPFNILT